jgi:hypothetical protein
MHAHAAYYELDLDRVLLFTLAAACNCDAAGSRGDFFAIMTLEDPDL